MSEGFARYLFHPDQYRGEAVVGIDIWGSGPGPELTPSERRRSLQRWVQFFESTPSLRDLTLSRVTDEVLVALQGQTRLTRLSLEYGPYTDLSPLESMSELTTLVLGGATRISDLRPLTRLPQLVDLEIENARRLRDHSALGSLPALRRLVVGRSFTGPRTDADSLDFLVHLTHLDELRWDPRVATRDYAALLGLTEASLIAVTPMKDMHPSMVDLEWSLPGMQAHARELADQRWPVFSSEGEVQMMSRDLQGRLTAEQVDEEEAEALWEEHEPFVEDFGLRGPVSGRTIRTLSFTARTRTEDFWLRVESPVVGDDVDVPPPDSRVIDSFAWAGMAEGPLLIWDAPIPDGAAADDYFGGNLDVWTPPEEIVLSTADLPPLPLAEFEPILQTVRAARSWLHFGRSRDRLAAESDEFVLRFAQTVALRAVELAPVADQMIASGVIRDDEFVDAIGSLITAGDDAVRAAVEDPRSVRRQDFRPAMSAVFFLASEVMSGRRKAEVQLVTPFDDVLAARVLERMGGMDAASGDGDEVGEEVRVQCGRAVVAVDGQLRERIVLADTNGVAPAAVHEALRTAIVSFGGVLAAGPEVARAGLSPLHGSTHALRIRRRSSLPLDEYIALYTARP